MGSADEQIIELGTMQLPGLGRMIAFHPQGWYSEEVSRLEIYMSKQVTHEPELVGWYALPCCLAHAVGGSLLQRLETAHCTMLELMGLQTGAVRRARELLNDFLACESGPNVPMADVRDLQAAAGLVRLCRTVCANIFKYVTAFMDDKTYLHIGANAAACAGDSCAACRASCSGGRWVLASPRCLAGALS